MKGDGAGRTPHAGRREAAATLTLRGRLGLSDRALWAVVVEFGSAVSALERPAEVRRFLRGMAGRTAGRRRPRNAVPRAEELIERAKIADLGLLAVGEKDYPHGLHDLDDPPAVLWTRGDWSVFSLPAVAVVGARRATESGRRVAYEIARGLARSGLVVVSGMALGVDGAAHEGALAGGGLTVAVLGSGADRPTPGSHRRLYDRIVQSGCVVSEFDPGTPAAPYNFPRRNRVIAGLAFAIVVVEAAERSGALITVDHALDLGRTVYAAPGPLDRPQSAGTNALIRDGASVVTSVSALVEELGPELEILSGRRSGGRNSEAGVFGSGLEGSSPGAASSARRALGEVPSGPTGMPTGMPIGIPTGLADGLPDGGPDRVPNRAASGVPGGTAGGYEEAGLRTLLANGPVGLDDLVRRSGIPVWTVAASLLEMELRGEIRMEGHLYRKAGR